MPKSEQVGAQKGGGQKDVGPSPRRPKVSAPKIEMLDAKIASALNKIIQNSQFKKKVSLEEQKAQKEDRFLRGKHIAVMIYDCFRVTGAHDTVLDYADLFCFTPHNDNIHSGIRKKMGRISIMSKIPSDDILASLYKLRTRESVQLKTVFDLYDMEIDQKISMPNFQKWKTMVKRSIDQKLRKRNFDTRHGRMETGEVVKNSKLMSGVEVGKGIYSKGPSFHEVEVMSKKRSIQGTSNHSTILRRPCRY